MRDLTIIGPFNVTGVSDTASRQRDLHLPPDARRPKRRPARRRSSSASPTQAYRGAVSRDDVQDAMKFYEQGRKSGDFESGIRMALQAILVSPRFLFRLEEAPAPR